MSYFWDAIGSVQEPLGVSMIASWQRVHSGSDVGVIYHLVSWTLLHVHHNYKAIKSSSMGRKSHYFMDRKGKWKPSYSGVLHAFMWYASSSAFAVTLGSQRDFLSPAAKEPGSSVELRSWCLLPVQGHTPYLTPSDFNFRDVTPWAVSPGCWMTYIFIPESQY